MKLIPAYMQDARIKSIFDTHRSTTPECGMHQSRIFANAFSKRAMMDNITVIQQSDIEIDKNGGSIGR